MTETAGCPLHQFAPFIASWPPFPGQVLLEGRQPASVILPSLPMKLNLKLCQYQYLFMRSLHLHLLMVEHDNSRLIIRKESFQFPQVARIDWLRGTTAGCRSSKTCRFSNYTSGCGARGQEGEEEGLGEKHSDCEV